MSKWVCLSETATKDLYARWDVGGVEVQRRLGRIITETIWLTVAEIASLNKMAEAKK